MASSPAPGCAAVDVEDAETYRGDARSVHGHHGRHEQAEEDEHHEHAATQQVNEDLPEQAQYIMLHRCRGTGKELDALDIELPYFIDANGSSTAKIIGRNADINIFELRREACPGQAAGLQDAR